MIRNATIEDVDGFVKVAKANHEESRYRRFGWNEPKVRARFAECVGLPNGIALVALADERVVGFVLGMVGDHPMFDGTLAFEYAIYVLPEYRGRMLGWGLLRRYVSEARRLGADDVNAAVTTDITMDRTDKIYSRAGLHAIGTLYNTQR